MLWLVGAGSKLALLVAALLPRGGVSWSVEDLVRCVGGVVFIGSEGWVCCNTCCGASLCCAFEVVGVVLDFDGCLCYCVFVLDVGG